MTTRRQLETLLTEAGSRPAPTPTPEFVSGLEARLLADARPVTAKVVTPLPERTPMRLLRPSLLAAAASFAAVVLVGALTGWFGRTEPTPEPSLTAAVDTVVELPDGREVAGTKGLDLPDGSIVTTGPEGHAAVGNVDLGPSQVAVIEEGRIKVTLPEVTLPPVTTPTVPTVPGLP
jgi:hypothetical protein